MTRGHVVVRDVDGTEAFLVREGRRAVWSQSLARASVVPEQRAHAWARRHHDAFVVAVTQCSACTVLVIEEGLCDACDRYFNPRDPFDTMEEARGER